MAGYNTSSLPRPTAPSGATRPLGTSSISPSPGKRRSYHAGESSASPSLHYDASFDTSSLDRPTPRIPQDQDRSSQYRKQTPNRDALRRSLPNKPRPSSGFLLPIPSNTVSESTRLSPTYRDGRRSSRIPVDIRKGKSPSRSSDASDLSESYDPRDNEEGRDGANTHLAHGDRPLSQATGRRTSRIPALRPSSAPLDVDATRIVSMALDLSESRRSGGGSLKQHLQQQRRTSRNISPRADRNLAPRIVSTSKLSSPLQPMFEQDGSYTYHFSSSTLNRAQRAKEYLELMAQYRRLLLFLPPLPQQAHSRPSPSSHPATPNSPNLAPDHPNSAQNRTLGRPYNPLQYIRNRKVRARERKAIDGEGQGFGDVPRVTDWIDEVATTFAATSLLVESPKLPAFSAADEWSEQQLPVSNIPRPVSTSSKPKRQRLEWSIDPADMIADVYWLEQGDNRYLIEDRHFAKIFGPKPEVQQTVAHSDEASQHLVNQPSSRDNSNSSGNGRAFSEQDAADQVKTEADVTTSTRDRARQKFHDWRGTHKHSSSSYSHHDFRKARKGSLSDTSDSGSDRRRRGRSGTITANENSLFEKQMSEIIAKEIKEEERSQSLKPVPGASPDRTVDGPGQGHGRKGSRIQIEDPYDKFGLGTTNYTTSPMYSGRESLEVPGLTYKSSVEFDSARPFLWEGRFRGQQDTSVLGSGNGASPMSSRPNSPTRNPFSKVKNIFRDRSRDRSRNHSRDRSRGRKDSDPRERNNNATDPNGPFSIATVTEDRMPLPERQRSKSSAREIPLRPPHESHKSHRSLGNLNLKADEQAKLKTILKGGAKFDDMFRGRVSKVTDLIRRKDSEDLSVTAENDSDTEYLTSQFKDSGPVSPGGLAQQPESRRPVKHYLDIMPDFKSAMGSTDKGVSHEATTSPGQVISYPASRSPRFDQLKPPRIDVRRASPVSSEFDEQDIMQRPRDSDRSRSNSQSRGPNNPIDSRSRQTSKELQNALSLYDNNNMSRTIDTRDSERVSDCHHLAIPNRTPLSQHTIVSRREVARLRTLILCSGIKAMELSRRAHEPLPCFSRGNKNEIGMPWADVAHFAPEGYNRLNVPQKDLYPEAGRILSQSINKSIEALERSVSEFSTQTGPALQQRVNAVHDRIAVDYMTLTRQAVDEADEVSLDMVNTQRLKVKSVVDTMDKMLRRRRRRLRWVRRAGWLAVEWVLVGFMWYVWFVVMIARVMIVTGRGIVSVIRWLLWL
ncbi:hypothetical protein GGS20DRAFT_535871 [Poronia punctata]|nr:hypothetical protein GGS20DRAFT_535871 [Poronia punctata]